MTIKKIIFNKKTIIILLFLFGTSFFVFVKLKKSFENDKKSFVIETISAFEKIVNFLPVADNTKKEIEVINKLTEVFLRQDDVSRKYLFLLQNNMELRPGGGFLGQYAIAEIKNGEVVSFFIEDANLLDQRITVRVSPPYPFTRMMSIKKWKFRDSNFSPDFPTNVEKAKYFYRLAGKDVNFDGVIAINATVLNNVLKITGPINVSGYGDFNSDNAVLKLEEQVEKAYLYNPELDTTHRKTILKNMAPLIINKLLSLGNIKKVADFALEELNNKDVILNFKDSELQKAVEEVNWAGRVNQDWQGDYLMLVDANMGALKSDYYIKRNIFYQVDLTLPKPQARLEYTYTHTATYGDWRTSDYHSYLRVYVPLGSNLLERKMVSYPNIQEEFGKTYFGFIAHTLIGRQTKAEIVYELPERVKENYKILIQKQSGVGEIPLKIKVKTKEGEFEKEVIMKEDVKFEFTKKIKESKK